MKLFKRNKLFTLIVLLTVITFIIGLLIPSMLDMNINNEISSNLKLFMNTIMNNKLNSSYLKDLVINNSIFITIISLLGISIIGIPVIIFLYITKVMLISLELCYLIMNISKYNILVIFIYIIPKLINLLLILLLVYFAISFSIILIKVIFFNKKNNLRTYLIRYLKIIVAILFIALVNSYLEYYLFLRIIKYLI
ncbi:MAG: stage II sporulation protein M [Bacilli bacterium]|nr:stage II sporulation protein M [Bacilli bacterium]